TRLRAPAPAGGRPGAGRPETAPSRQEAHSGVTCGRIYLRMTRKPRPIALSGADIGSDSLHVELDTERILRSRNKLYYRFNHWPIWIFVFFIAPGPLTFDLFERVFDARLVAWLGVVLLGTCIAGLRGKLPGCEPPLYIIGSTEDRPNPLYRRVCYTTAWGEVVA